MTYWEKRQKQLDQQLEKDEARLKNRLVSFYTSESSKIEKEIAAYYQKYGIHDVLQYRTLMQSLPDEDRELLLRHMDEFAAKYPEYAYLIPVRESIYKLNRLEGLQYSIKMHLLEIGAVSSEQMEAHLKKQAFLNANAAAEAMGFGKNFYTMDSEIVKKCVNAAWTNGKNFSQRIWDNADKLSNYLNTDIAQGFARGDSYAKLSKQIQRRFLKVSKNDAYRLIYTEGTFVQNEARASAFEQDTEEYVYRVQYDKIRRNGWRDICDDLDGQIFKWNERKAGVNFPPMHAWCHCTATPHISDNESFIDNYVNKHGDSQPEKIRRRLIGQEESDIIKKTAWDNDLPPRGQLSDDIMEQLDKYIDTDENAYYQFIADDLKVPLDEAKEYVDCVMGFSVDYFTDIRKLQRDANAEIPDKELIKHMASQIEDYIKKAPRWNGGETYRGYTVSDEELSQYEAGFQFHMGGTSSWSNVKSIAYDFASQNESYERPNSVIVHCDTQSKGTGIKHVSAYKNESEVLVSKDAEYKIIRTEIDDDNITHVFVEEV